jgi:hypothetical protein
LGEGPQWDSAEEREEPRGCLAAAAGKARDERPAYG